MVVVLPCLVFLLLLLVVVECGCVIAFIIIVDILVIAIFVGFGQRIWYHHMLIVVAFVDFIITIVMVFDG